MSMGRISGGEFCILFHPLSKLSSIYIGRLDERCSQFVLLSLLSKSPGPAWSQL